MARRKKQYAVIDSVKISGLDYKIKFRKNLKVDGDCVNGYVIDTNLTIFIESSISMDLMKIIILHEIMHAILFSSKASGQDLDEIEEVYVNATAYGVYNVMKDNPNIKRFIFEDVEFFLKNNKLYIEAEPEIEEE